MPAQLPILISEARQGGRLSPIHHRWIDFNRQLTGDARFLPNERSIEEWLEALKDMEIADLRIFWLTFSRIAELAIKQAGDYADNCEFQAAGDLLVNPRRIDIYRRGCPTPIAKDRHRGLSDQFAQAIGDENPVAWLCRETIPHIREAPLIPQLERLLSTSEMMDSRYLTTLTVRMRRVADTIAFLNAWQIDDWRTLLRRMETGDPADRRMISVNLCRFDLDYFYAMGDDIEKLILTHGGCSRFLRHLPFEKSGRIKQEMII
ncbi:hypothetical protein [uncultured Desulfosarcina sp.]|uniref:hypothetical protein n=1 Tax=uncultured Desulfosarcina sp. TaxID=218289 RepID=UPI0029C61E51|nr:hypothetical protein [uncultured Desulfosarcina sp.]